MIKKTLLLIAILTTSISFGSTIKWSNPIESGKRAPAPIVIGQNNEHIFIIRYASIKKMFIDRYLTKNLTSKKSQIFISQYKDKKLKLEAAQMLNGQPVILTSFYNKKKKLIYFFLLKISPNLITSKPILLGSIPVNKKKVFSTITEGGIREFELNISDDGTSAFSIFPQGTMENPSKLNKGILLNSKFEKQAETTIKLPFLPNDFKILKRQLSNDGLYYILGFNTIKGKSTGIIKTTRIYRDEIYLYAIDTENGDLYKTVIDINEDIEQMTMQVLKNGNIGIACLTSTEGKGVNGSLFIIYDNGLNELNRTTTPFEDDFITPTYSKKQKKELNKKKNKAKSKGKKVPIAIFYDYFLDHIIETKDGNLTILAEQYYVVVETRTSTNPSTGATTTTRVYHYYYNDIIAINYDRDGIFNWKNAIKKRQHSVNDGGFYSSYLPIKIDDEVGLIFNSTELENAEDDDDLSRIEKKKAAKRTICMSYTLHSDGEVSSEELFAFDEKEKLKIAPKYSSQSENGDIVIFAKSRKGRKIGIVTL